MYPRMIWVSVKLYDGKIVRKCVNFRPPVPEEGIIVKGFFLKNDEEMEKVYKEDAQKFFNQFKE